MHTEHAQPSPPPLTGGELDHLHHQDRTAAAIVSGLMALIFFIGMLMYAAIAWVCKP